MIGRVPVKVSTESGPIKIGDRITSSSLSGTGMKATKDGVTVGIALQDFDGSAATTSATIGGTDVKTGKILVFVNLGYSKLDGSVPSLASHDEAKLATPTNAWSIDQQSGKVNVNFLGNLNLQGNSLINVSKIIGMDGRWSLDESGNLVTETITTKKLCLEEVCVEKEQLKTLLQNAGLLNTQNTIEVSPPAGVEISTTTATGTNP